MSRCSPHHLELNADGIGKCSVPMWCTGIPAGFCDEPAYGSPPPSGRFYSYARQTQVREDGRYDGYVPGLACVAHGGPRSRVFKDGTAWCAVFPDFIDLQESHAGFGVSPEEARTALQKATGRDAS